MARSSESQNEVIKALSSDLDGFAKANGLTPREMDIVRLLLEKVVSVEGIAKKLGVSPNTVKNHFQKIFQKTRTNAKAELLAAFVQYLIDKNDVQAKDGTTGGAARAVSMTILLADDDDNFADLMRSAFEKLKHEVTLKTVKDGIEVLDYMDNALKGNSPNYPLPHLILLDLRMPRMDGYEALKALKEKAGSQSIPVIAISGSDDPDDIERIYNLGGASYIRKPSKFQALVSTMDALANFWGEYSEPAGRALRAQI